MTAYLRGIMRGEKDTYFDQIKQVGVLTTVPLILLVGPVIGFFFGSWIDRKWHIFPWVTIIMVGLGFMASGREVARLIKSITTPDSSGKNP